MEKVEEESERKSSFRNQYFASIVVNLPMIAYNISIGWSSAANPLLTSAEKTPLPSGAMDMHEVSWVTSILYFGGFVGTFFFGYAAKKFGRKWPILIISALGTVSWLLIYFARNPIYLYVSRFLSGFFGSALMVILPVYLVEIASDRVRGIVLSSMGISSAIGILIGYILGGYFNFYTSPIFAVALSILFVIVFFFVPETPSFLLLKNRIEETEKSIEFYQNSDIERLRNAIASSERNNTANSFKWSDLKSNPSRKAIIIGIFLSCLSYFSGIFAILNYSSTIFEKTTSTLSPNTSTVIVGSIQVLGSILANFFIDRAGRKILYILSSLGTALGLTVLGVFMMLKSWNYAIDAFHWTPIASLSFSVLITHLAVRSLPFVVTMEVLPKNMKEFGMAFCIMLSYVLIFALTKLLPFLMDELEFHAFFLFAGCCLLGALFIILYLPETKGKSYEQIMESLQ